MGLSLMLKKTLIPDTQPLTESLLNRINQLADSFDLPFNPEKCTLMGPDQVKLVTGLQLLGEEVVLPDDFIKEMHHAIEKLGHAVDVQYHAGAHPDWLENFQDQVEGMIEYASFILGEQDEIVLDAEARLDRALDPQDEYSPLGWQNFAYFKF